jgi:hypothetical protein
LGVADLTIGWFAPKHDVLAGAIWCLQ